MAHAAQWRRAYQLPQGVCFVVGHGCCHANAEAEFKQRIQVLLAAAKGVEDASAVGSGPSRHNCAGVGKSLAAVDDDRQAAGSCQAKLRFKLFALRCAVHRVTIIIEANFSNSHNARVAGE